MLNVYGINVFSIDFPLPLKDYVLYCIALYCIVFIDLKINT